MRPGDIEDSLCADELARTIDVRDAWPRALELMDHGLAWTVIGRALGVGAACAQDYVGRLLIHAYRASPAVRFEVQQALADSARITQDDKLDEARWARFKSKKETSMLTATVTTALARVHAQDSGEEHFERPDEAEAFQEQLIKKYPVEGYATRVDCRLVIDGKVPRWRVNWYVGGAD